MKEIAEFYLPYFMGMLDTLALFKGSLAAADVKDCLYCFIIAICRDAYDQRDKDLKKKSP